MKKERKKTDNNSSVSVDLIIYEKQTLHILGSTHSHLSNIANKTSQKKVESKCGVCRTVK